MNKQLHLYNNKHRGQGMTEYLIITALIAVGAIGMVGIMGENIQANFATIANALRGDGKKVETAEEVQDVERFHMGNFHEGVKSRGK